MDQAIAQTGGKVDENAVLDMLKRADRGVVVDLMKTLLSGDAAAALNKVDQIYNNGADLAMLLTDMMEWTHWATRMHPALRAGDADASPYTADQRDKIREINSHVTLNTLSRIWQVMVAAVPEMQATGNQKQCFDMLVVRLMHIADLPSVPEILRREGATAAPRTTTPRETPDTCENTKNPESAKGTPETVTISSGAELAAKLQAAKEILLYSYYSSNIEIVEFSDGEIKYFDRANDADFASKLAKWLLEKTGHAWHLVRAEKSENTQTITEQNRAELEADPMVSSAMSLFEDAQIISVGK